MRTISKSGVDLIKSFEKCELVCFDSDGSGTPTIGWGRTRGLTKADIGIKHISQETADELLLADLENTEQEIDHQLGPSVVNIMTDNQYGALCAFVYNEGSMGVSLLKVLKAKRFDLVPAELARYVYARQPDGKMKKLTGLVRRRAAEQVLWQTDEPGSLNVDPPSSVTRAALTPPAPSSQPAAQPLQKQGSFLAAAGTGIMTLAAVVQPQIASVTDMLNQVSTTIQPYADGNHHVEQVRTTIIGIVGVLSVVTVVLLWVRHFNAKSESDGVVATQAK